MFKLYWAPRTGAFGPEATLLEVGAAFEAVRVDYDSGEHQGDGYRALNPAGQIPTLVLDDGTVLTESAAICLWLVDAFPDAGLIPPAGTPARATVLRWVVFGACNLYENVLRHYYAPRYTTDPAGVDAVKAAALQRVEAGFDIVEAAIGPGPFMLGESISVADIYLLMQACWHPDMPGLLASRPKLARLCLETGRRPAVADALERYNMARDVMPAG
ncbi:MAG: glutathione S-transferase family protein [Alphaproteobacteria bacterium]